MTAAELQAASAHARANLDLWSAEVRASSRQLAEALAETNRAQTRNDLAVSEREKAAEAFDAVGHAIVRASAAGELVAA